jgi:hypothetical protein
MMQIAASQTLRGPFVLACIVLHRNKDHRAGSST